MKKIHFRKTKTKTLVNLLYSHVAYSMLSIFIAIILFILLIISFIKNNWGGRDEGYLKILMFIVLLGTFVFSLWFIFWSLQKINNNILKLDKRQELEYYIFVIIFVINILCLLAIIFTDSLKLSLTPEIILIVIISLFNGSWIILYIWTMILFITNRKQDKDGHLIY